MEQLSFDDVEAWKPVVGYEGLYEVSSLGRVRSLPRRGAAGGLLTLSPTKGCLYLKVGLTRNSVTRTPKVHTLVARAFLGPYPDDQEVCHGPGGPRDNRLVNLSYGTHAKNMGPDRRRDGMVRSRGRKKAAAGRRRQRPGMASTNWNVGTHHPLAKLNDEIVLEIRRRAASGESKHSLARRFGVDRATIRSAVNGATWKHIPFPDAAEASAA